MSRFAPLRSLLDRLDAEPLSPAEHHEVIVGGVRRYLAGEAPLEDALGLRSGDGQRSAHTEANIEARDKLLRESAAEFFPGLLVTQQARGLHLRWTRYEASRWPHERTLDAVPPHRIATLEGRFWAILKKRDTVPAERTIRAILRADLATSSGGSLPPSAPTLPPSGIEEPDT